MGLPCAHSDSRALNQPIQNTMYAIAHPKIAWVYLTLFCALIFLPGISTIAPIDRDEARYIQASRQMLESGDFIRIRFQQAPRHKKPAGVHWMQVGAVSVLSNPSSTQVWPYRIVSVLAAWFTVLATFRLGTTLFGQSQAARLASWFGAGALASCLGLMSEAHQAKTDAVLCLTIVLMQLSLARVYLNYQPAAPRQSTPHQSTPWLFYVALGAGTMVKGPVAPAVAVLTVAALCLFERDIKWLTTLRPLRGSFVLAAIVAPWAIAIHLATGGTFFSQAASEDIVPKLISAHESHGAPPGYYFFTAYFMFWPAALLALPALTALLSQRADDDSDPLRKSGRFLLAWLIPTWLCLELVPTKLPHYSLVLYPSLALMISALLLRSASPQSRIFSVSLWIAVCLTAIAGLVLASAPVVLAQALDVPITSAAIVMSLSALIVVAASSWFALKRRWFRAMFIALLCASLYHALLAGQLAPSLKPLWLSNSLVDVIDRELSTPTLSNRLSSSAPRSMPQLAIAGYHEPSVVFNFGTQTILTDAQGVARHLATASPALAILPKNTFGSAAENYLASLAVHDRKAATVGLDQVVQIGSVRGLNYSKGKWLELDIFLKP